MRQEDHGKGQDDKLNGVLLSRTEIQWLLGKIKVSKLFEYQLKSRIKKKVQSLMELELPLLVKTNFIDCYDEPAWMGFGHGASKRQITN
jgi:hypothetical protein